LKIVDENDSSLQNSFNLRIDKRYACPIITNVIHDTIIQSRCSYYKYWWLVKLQCASWWFLMFDTILWCVY
jgi:hypothetical protein